MLDDRSGELVKLMKIFEEEWNKNALEQYLSGDLYDCTIHVQKDEGAPSKTFKCHRLVLATGSPIFKTMLHGHFSEAKAGADEIINVKDVSPECFDVVMKFFYGKSIFHLLTDLDITIEVVKFADMWQIPILRQIAEKACFSFDHTIEDLCELYMTFKLFNCETQIPQTLKEIENRCGELIHSNFWLQTPKEVVQAIVSAESLNIYNENELLHKVIEWGYGQMTSNENIGGDQRSLVLWENIEFAVKNIRFLSIGSAAFSADDLLNAFPDTVRLSLLSELRSNPPSVPSGYSTSTRKRFRFGAEFYFNFLVWGSAVLEYYKGLEARSLDFSVNQNCYLIGCRLHSIDYLNNDRKISVQIQLKQNKKMVLEQTFEYETVPPGGHYLQFYRPVLLQSGMDYGIAAYHLTDAPRKVEYGPLKDKEFNFKDINVKLTVKGCSCGDVKFLKLATCQ